MRLSSFDSYKLTAFDQESIDEEMLYVFAGLVPCTGIELC